jgi:N-acetyl-gamma-glutamylphosphate reductase
MVAGQERVIDAVDVKVMLPDDVAQHSLLDLIHCGTDVFDHQTDFRGIDDKN